ncbi:DUF4214 domain-containing protein [Desulfobacter sp. UBA2225]|uniref:DUF4214 domain-containing protein n=1 Tax=Desulfobacter sp. UBA2225 TaxID=1961413 RepID=UPI00257CC305|nr:DUF4214 domain-containing protein [Desulfobacter sp. UBA2225]
MAVTREQVAQIYVATFNRAPLDAGLDYWTGSGFTIEQIATSFFDQDEAKGIYTDGGEPIPSEDFVTIIFNNLFGRAPVEAGLEYWSTALDEGTVSQAEMILAVANGATGDDAQILANKTEVGLYYADMGGTETDWDLSDIDATDASVEKAIADINETLKQEIVLTVNADNRTGSDFDDLFTAPVLQNETGSGELANTLETGDILDGRAGQDILAADLIATGTIQDIGQGAAIGATTTGIEEVYLTAITPQVDTANNTTFISTIDAGRMADVEQWWTDESRSDIRIEDVRTRPEDTTLGMRLTDPGVSYEVYFNPLFMEGDLNAESALTIRVQEITDGLAPETFELANITVREINFDLNGESYSLDTQEMRAADTWAELETAIANALAADADLSGLTVTHTGNGVFLIEDSAGGVFAIEEAEALIFGAAAGIDVRNRVDVGMITEEGLISSTLVVDGVGSGSRGGIVNIAAMSGSRGVEKLDVLVDRDSGITSLSSVNSPNTVGRSFDDENQLEEVYLSHLDGGAHGKFELGLRTFDTRGVSTTTDDRLQTNGLTDVRIFDATGFDAALKVGASLTAAVFDKYLLGVSEPVQFSYLLGDGGSNLSLAVDNGVAGDPDFQLEIIGGVEADRVNLEGLAVKENTSVDGGLGENTMEITTSTGWAANQDGYTIPAGFAAATDYTAAETSFSSVENIDKLVIATQTINVGNQAGAAAAIAAATLPAINFDDTTHDLVAGGLADISEIVIATDGEIAFNDTTIVGAPAATTNIGANTRLVNLNANEQTVVVSGKNQTLGAGNNDNNQNFGIVRFTDTTGEELNLQLANTARVSGVLTAAAVTIDNQVGNVSDVRTLNLDSAGVRNTRNVVTTLNGNLVNTFMLEGTQNLTITNLASASNSVDAVAASRDDLLVDGSGLGTFDPQTGNLVKAADLYLGVTGAVITAIDAALGTNRTVELIGTEGNADILNIRDGVTTTNATDISEFETIRFGDGGVGVGVSPSIFVATNFNATNVSDVELYDLVDSTATINLFNLRATENVQINAGTLDVTDTFVESIVAADVTLAAANNTSGSQVNVDFVSDATTALFVPTFWSVGGANLNVQDFQTISMDMGGTTGESYNYNFNLNTLANPTTGNVNARTLEITGGLYDLNYLNTDSLTLNELDTALTKVDFSAYNGDFVTQGWDSTQGTNAEVVVNEFGFIFDVGGDNTVFSVPAGALVPALETLEFDFVTGGYAGLAAGDSIVITFAGGEYVFTNDTGALITAANLDNAIVADAVNAPNAFNIAAGVAPDSILITPTINGNMPDPTDAPGTGYIEEVTAAGVVTDLIGAATATVTASLDGDLNPLNVTGFDLITSASEFLTKFVFTEDVYDQGVVWQIDNFQAIDAGDNVTISNQTQLDLRALDVDSSTKITISAGDVFAGSVALDAQAIADYTAYGNYLAVAGDGIVQILELTAADTVITSNDGLDFTIILQGVNSADLQNENIVGIA